MRISGAYRRYQVRWLINPQEPEPWGESRTLRGYCYYALYKNVKPAVLAAWRRTSGIRYSKQKVSSPREWRNWQTHQP
jgi:hypothetical protein